MRYRLSTLDPETSPLLQASTRSGTWGLHTCRPNALLLISVQGRRCNSDCQRFTKARHQEPRRE